MSRKLTYEDAVNFLEKELNIQNISERLEKNKHEFLDDIIRSFHAHVVYTTIYLHSMKVSERRFPHPDTINEEVLTKKAGTCSVLNGFFHHLLQALSYDCFISNSQGLKIPIPNNHVVILVRNLDKEGDLHYVDVGMGLPTFKAISLGNLPQTYTFAFHQMRIEKRGDIYIRMHHKNFELETIDEENNEWIDFLIFNTTPRDLNFFNEAMEAVFSATGNSILNKTIIADLYPMGRAVTLKNMTLRIWDEAEKTIEKKDFESIEEAAEQLPKYFPMLDKEIIKCALTLWKKLDLSEN